MDLESCAEEQIEMMLMQMGYSDNDFIQFNNHNNNINPNINNSPTFTNLHPPIIFISTTDHHEPPPFLPNSSGGAWRADEFSGDSKRNSMAAMREMIFRIAAMQPIHIDPETVKPPKRKNVKISSDPQSVAARHRRERISERIRILQRLVPGGTKMDTASMLDEAIHYVKFLKNQVQSLERVAVNRPPPPAVAGMGFPVPMSSGSYFPVVGGKGYQIDRSSSTAHNVHYLEEA